MLSALLIADVRGWVFDRNLRDMAVHLAGQIESTIWYMEDGRVPDALLDAADMIYCPYRWDLDARFPYEKAIGSLQSSIFRPDAPGPPDATDVAEVKRWTGFQVVNREIQTALWRLGCPNVWYLTNPVDTRVFYPQVRSRPHDRIVASWSGNAMHPSPAGIDVKGFRSIAVPACRRTGVRLVVAERNSCPVPLDAMPAFHAQGNIVLCTSLYEGASSSIMAAMACGQAVLTTDCGNMREIRESQLAHLEATGIEIVERQPTAFAEALAALTPERAAEMGRLNAVEIAARWSWSAWAGRYAEMLRSVLP